MNEDSYFKWYEEWIKSINIEVLRGMQERENKKSALISQEIGRR